MSNVEGNGQHDENLLNDMENMEDTVTPTPETAIPLGPGGQPPNLEIDTPPAYLADEAPEGTMNYIKWALMHGVSEDELVDDKQNAASIRVAAMELEHDGYRQRPSRKQRTTPLIPGTEVSTSKTTIEKRSIRAGQSLATKSFAKGAPAEVIIDTMMLPDGMEALEPFLKGTKFGMSLLVAAIRATQDLATTGISLAKPLIEMAKDMRAGEAVAAENAAQNAAGEAASQAADAVAGQFAPYVAKLNELLEKNEADKKVIEEGGDDPKKEMNKMMMQTMRPVFKQLTGKLTSRLTGIDTSKPDDQLPDGWTKK
jgi:hypothetical protein